MYAFNIWAFSSTSLLAIGEFGSNLTEVFKLHLANLAKKTFTVDLANMLEFSTKCLEMKRYICVRVNLNP